VKTFSFERFVQSRIVAKDAIALEAKLWLDGDTYLVIPNPRDEANVYRVSKQDLHIMEVLPVSGEPSATVEPLYRVQVRKDAPCIRFETRTVEQFWNSRLDDSLGAAALPLATLRAKITFGANAEGTLEYNGLTRPCLGKSALPYPTDLTVNVTDKYRRRYSSEFQVWMDFAVLIWGQRGIFIHEGPATLGSNGGETAGCIHLAAPHAEEFFNWITGRTRIEISYPW
jgi:hypothetical protein